MLAELRGELKRDELAYTAMCLAASNLVHRPDCIVSARPQKQCKRTGPCVRGCTETSLRPNGNPTWHAPPKRLLEIIAGDGAGRLAQWADIEEHHDLCAACYLTAARDARKAAQDRAQPDVVPRSVGKRQRRSPNAEPAELPARVQYDGASGSAGR